MLKAILLMATLVAGCATFADTPAQTLTAQHVATCEQETGVKIQGLRISPNGSWQGFGDTMAMRPVIDCMARYSKVYR